MTKLYVAKDKSGKLYLFNELPKVDIFVERYLPIDNYHLCEEIDADLFPDLTFENGPIRVTLTILGDAE